MIKIIVTLKCSEVKRALFELLSGIEAIPDIRMIILHTDRTYPKHWINYIFIPNKLKNKANRLTKLIIFSAEILDSIIKSRIYNETSANPSVRLKRFKEKYKVESIGDIEL